MKRTVTAARATRPFLVAGTERTATIRSEETVVRAAGFLAGPAGAAPREGALVGAFNFFADGDAVCDADGLAGDPGGDEPPAEGTLGALGRAGGVLGGAVGLVPVGGRTVVGVVAAGGGTVGGGVVTAGVVTVVTGVVTVGVGTVTVGVVTVGVVIVGVVTVGVVTVGVVIVVMGVVIVGVGTVGVGTVGVVIVATGVVTVPGVVTDTLGSVIVPGEAPAVVPPSAA